MTKLEKNQEKNRSNTRKTRGKKMRTIAGIGAFAIGTTFMTGCGTNDSDLTKLSKEYDDKIEQRDDHKDELKNIDEQIKELQEDKKEKQEEIAEDNKDINQLKIELQKAKVNPAK